MKRSFWLQARRSRLAAVLAALTIPLAARAAGPFTVTTTSDTHAVNPAASALDGNNQISVRSAIEAANAQAGATTINVPAGTFNLALGELDLSPNGGNTAVIAGAGAASTIISQTDPTNRVFDVDSKSIGGAVTVLAGLTIQGGHDGADYLGGAGILAGSLLSATKDSLTLSNCWVQNNHCNTNTTREPGGGVQMAGGNLTIIGCTLAGNSSGQSLGGAVFTLAQAVPCALNISNSFFVNNSVTNNSGAGPDGGGAIIIWTTNGSVHNLAGCTFTNNRALGAAGDTYGGAIQINGGVLNITGSTFVNNSVTGQGGLGGAIYADAGSVNLTFCRLTANTASVAGSGLYNHGSNLATTVATNNWWGCNGGPGAAGCDVATGDGSPASLMDAPWLIITNTASPNPIMIGQSASLTASVLQNSAGQGLSPAQLGVLIGLPVSWSAGAHGFLGPAQGAIQANGQATAIYTNDNTCNNGAPSVTLDNGTAVATIVVQCSDLTLSKTNSVNGTVVAGSGWTWTLHVANTGPAPAPFPASSILVLDNLPITNLIYSPPLVVNATGLSGTPLAAIDANDNLTVTAPSPLTLNAGGSFDVTVTASADATGSFSNPRSGGICMVDPYNIISESNEGNNSGSDTVVVTCPAIAGAVTGATTICPAGSAVITVAVTGGIPPYTVTLNNGGGTQTGGATFQFPVSPSATTTYALSSGSDTYGCPIDGVGSATVTVAAPASPVITLSPAAVFAHSAGNVAGVPAAYASYAWTIANGTIIGPTNQPSVTYIAGVSNRVSLSVTVANAFGCDAVAMADVPVITGFSVHTNVVFTDGLAGTTMTMAFDGTNYWSCSGGSSSGTRLAKYGLDGALIATYSPGLDFRSLMVRADGTLLAHDVASQFIYQQTNPGVFVNSGITLTGGSLYGQSSVVLNGAGTEYDAMNGGTVSRWSTNGTFLGTVNLTGFGAIPGENSYPQNRGLAVLGNLWLTYSGANILSLWDTNGNRITQLNLPGAGTSFHSDFSLSYANGKVFIVDAAGGAWRAFDLYSAASVAVLAAGAQPAWNADVANKISGVGPLSAVDLIPVASGAAIPTLAQLRHYQSVMFFSDLAFTDPTALGNVLADYLDQGGGVVVQALALATNNATYAVLGRISTNGYLPFTATSYISTADPTLVKDLPSHPLLDGVNTFDGGTGGYQNTPIYTNAGAFQAAHWSTGVALVGGRNDGAGRCAALNFFPASSDVNSLFWKSSTDGARLMVNALLWSGGIPPAIVSGPADQAVPPGATATFSVAAAGTAPLGYQWRLNGTNLIAATNNLLSVAAQAGDYGAYSVVVSNPNGQTTSLNAMLLPQLHFLPPVIAPGGGFSLYLVDSAGGAVAADRAGRINLYSSTNLAAPFSWWGLLTNALVPAGTALRADGFNAGGPVRFFRATEAP